jgi:para-aminobenzoate synthetase component 1
MHVRPVALSYDPWQVLERWPAEVGVAAAIAGDGAARWSIIGVAGRCTHDAEEAFATTAPACGASPATDPTHPPFGAGWLALLSYEWGWQTESAARLHAFGSVAAREPRRSAWPLTSFVRVDAALIFDHFTNRWWELGELDLASRLGPPRDLHTDAGEPISSTGRERYEASVRRTLDYIRAGDVYQANIAHEMHAWFDGDPLDWFIARGREVRPRYGAFVSLPSLRLAAASLSPELFLEHDPITRRLATRPMKGTRPADAALTDLEHSDKDRAELAMIVDLLRNDVGRVSELGSVRLESPRDLERHGSDVDGVLQATATIAGTLRRGLAPLDAVRACFPGGSVTGAPKVRAMQVIEELEPSPRGPYCGSMGYVADGGWMRLNVAIRTALFDGARIAYRAGAGIVADSDPREEWNETLVKARAAWGRDASMLAAR